jgi:hypothetical protein
MNVLWANRTLPVLILIGQVQERSLDNDSRSHAMTDSGVLYVTQIPRRAPLITQYSRAGPLNAKQHIRMNYFVVHESEIVGVEGPT